MPAAIVVAMPGPIRDRRDPGRPRPPLEIHKFYRPTPSDTDYLARPRPPTSKSTDNFAETRDNLLHIVSPAMLFPPSLHEHMRVPFHSQKIFRCFRDPPRPRPLVPEAVSYPGGVEWPRDSPVALLHG